MFYLADFDLIQLVRSRSDLADFSDQISLISSLKVLM